MPLDVPVSPLPLLDRGRSARGSGLVDSQRPALKRGAVEPGDGQVRPLAHLDEAEAARLAGLPVGDEMDPGDGPVLAERPGEISGRGLEG